MEQQRYVEADGRYHEALDAAKSTGDVDLQGTLVQHRASLQDDLGHYESAVSLYHEALELFRKAGDTRSEMLSADLLGTAERNRGQLEAAEGWYARARELAEKLKDRSQLATTAQNVGILYQNRAEQAATPAERETWLRRAVGSVKESLAIRVEMSNQVGAAGCYGQLGILHFLLGELDEAARNAHESLSIHQDLKLPDVWKDYNSLAEIARAGGDGNAAAEWQARRDAKLAELKRLRRGEG